MIFVCKDEFTKSSLFASSNSECFCMLVFFLLWVSFRYNYINMPQPLLNFKSVFPALCWTSLSSYLKLKSSSKHPQMNRLSHLISSPARRRIEVVMLSYHMYLADPGSKYLASLRPPSLVQAPGSSTPCLYDLDTELNTKTQY